MNILEVKNLKKSFGNKEVLKGVDMSIPEGCIFGFVGMNGAGKTTTMKIILGLIGADAGEVYVCGKKVSGSAAETNRCIGYLPDVPQFYDYMTSAEYLEFIAEIAEYDGDIKERAGEMLSLVGLEDAANRRIKGYSRGMKQRLGIAQALFAKPKLLICDEPTSALDPVGRREILELLVKAKQDTTVLFSTHILSDVERIADEVAMLHEGRIGFAGKAEKILADFGGDSYMLELSSGSEYDRMREELKKAGINAEVSAEEHLIIRLGGRQETAAAMHIMSRENIVPLKLEKNEADLEEIFMKQIDMKK